MRVEITNNLKELRTKKGLSQSQLAKKCGVAPIIIQKYEYGFVDMKVAKFTNLVKLCNGLGCKLSDLFNEEDFVKLVRKAQRKQRG